MGVQYDKICALLTETVMLMCKNGVQYTDELKVQGLIGLTADKEVYIIQINEVVKADGITEAHKNEGVQLAHSSTYPSHGESDLQDNFVQNLSATRSQDNRINKKKLHIVEKENLDSNQKNKIDKKHKHSNIDNIVKRIYHVNSLDKVASFDDSETTSQSSNRMMRMLTQSANCQRDSFEGDCREDSRGSQQMERHEGTKFFDDHHEHHDQDYPIDLHINHHDHNNNQDHLHDYNNNHQNNSDNNMLYDVKPSADDLEEWRSKSAYKTPAPKKKKQSKGVSEKAAKKVKESKPAKNSSSKKNDNKNNNNNNTGWEMKVEEGCSGEYLPGLQTHEDFDPDLKSNNRSNNNLNNNNLNNSMVSFDSTKYHCNLCTASYKHYCNLLTHEVKVHGRQKKRGGRKRKSEGMLASCYDGGAGDGGASFVGGREVYEGDFGNHHGDLNGDDHQDACNVGGTEDGMVNDGKFEGGEDGGMDEDAEMVIMSERNLALDE